MLLCLLEGTVDKSYSYRQSKIVMSFLLPTILMIGLFIWGLYGLVTVGPLWLYKLIVMVMPVLFLSSFWGLHHPTAVQLTDRGIAFKSFGLKHEYAWDAVETLKLKQYPLAGKTYIRIGEPRLFGGRYWLSEQMDGYRKLVDFLTEKAEAIEAKRK